MPSCYELLGRSFHIDLDDGIRWTRLEPPYSSAEAAIAVFDVMARGGLRLRVRGPAIVGNQGESGRIFAESYEGRVSKYPAPGRAFLNHI